MSNLTLSLPVELKKKMNEFEYINWSAAIRLMIEKKIQDLETVDQIAQKSSLSEHDVNEIIEKVNHSLRKEATRLLHEARNRR